MRRERVKESRTSLFEGVEDNVCDRIEEKDSEEDDRRSPEDQTQYPSPAPGLGRQVQVLIRGLFRPSVPSILGDELLFLQAAAFEVYQ